MKKELEFYQESGKTDFGKLLPYFLLLVISTLVLAYLYGAFVALIPFIYVKSLLCFGFAYLMAKQVELASFAGHIRNIKVKLLLGLLVGLLGYYFAWVSFLTVSAAGSFSSPLNYVLNARDPTYVITGISILKEAGDLPLAQFTSDHFLNLLIWFIEAFILVGLPVLQVKYRKVVPYSEKFKQFYSCQFLPDVYRLKLAPKAFAQDLVNNQVSTFRNNTESAQGEVFTRFRLYYIDDEIHQYVDILESRINLTNSMPSSMKDKVIVANLKVSTETADWMKENLLSQ